MSGSDYTTTPNLGLYRPNYDMDDGLWGTHLNANADKLDAVLGSSAHGPFLPLSGVTNLFAAPPPIGSGGANSAIFTTLATSGLATFNSGTSYSSQVAPGGVTDLSKHIALYSTTTGISITGGRFNIVTGSGALFVNAGGADVASIGPTGVTSYNAMQIGGASGPTWTTGSGVPSSTQPVGSLYSRVSTWAAGATLYVSKGGGAWTAVASV